MPAFGSDTCCVLTSVPSSSTSSVTFCPSKPDCDSTTSTISVVPLSAVFGVTTRPTWMSFDNVSRPTPIGEDRKSLGLEPEDRVAERRIRGVGAVAHHHQARDRQTGQLLPHARQRRAEARLRAAERQVAFLRRARRRAREAERADGEAFGQRLEQPAIGGAELALHERCARLAVHIGDLHAARIVEQHAEEILLRHRGAHDEQRPEHADQDDGENREADRRERDALARAAVALAIGQDRQPSRNRHGGRRDVRPRRGREPEFSLTEDDRGEFEEKSEEGVEHEFLRNSTSVTHPRMPHLTRRSWMSLLAAALPATMALPLSAQQVRRPAVVNGRRYLQYDVFTDKPLAGNQLAVFTETAGLTAARNAGDDARNEVLRMHLRPARRSAPAPTCGCGSSARPTKCSSPDIP